MSEAIQKGTAVRWKDRTDPNNTVGISYSKTYIVEGRGGTVIRVNGLLFDVSLFERSNSQPERAAE